MPSRRSRTRRPLVILVAALALVAVIALRGDLPLGGAGGNGPPDAAATLDADRDNMERAAVLGVVDGDTIDVEIDGREERVRYYGVDTPERGDECFDDATDRNAELVGDEVLLLPDARERDRYGRLLRYVFTPDGESVDAALVYEGLGRAWTDDGAYRDDLLRLEEGARDADRGCLWQD